MNDEAAGNPHSYGFYKAEKGCWVLLINSLWQKIAPHALELAYSGQKNCAKNSTNSTYSLIVGMS